eukprot:NODE_233_length_13658_cov_0.453647.p7 type:complete len:191 gc:universal NODE_233_length_13658_cov_0.453647:10476-9904(-)
MSFRKLLFLITIVNYKIYFETIYMINLISRLIYTLALLLLSATIVGTAADIYLQIHNKSPDVSAFYFIILISLYGIVIASALLLGCIRFITSYITMSKIPSFDLQIAGKYKNETQIQTKHFAQLTKMNESVQVDLGHLMKLYYLIDWQSIDSVQKKSFKQQTHCLFKRNPSDDELKRVQQLLEFLAQRDK